MTSAAPDPAAVVGVGLAVILALGAALWKAGNLRGEVNRAWAQRVDAVTTALTDRALDELQALRRETDRLLGDPDAENPPLLASVDPAPLVRRAEAVARYAQTRDRLDGYFRRLLRLAPLLIPTLIVLILSTALLTLYYSKIEHFADFRLAGLITLVGGGVVGVILFALYLIAEHRLSGAELLGGSRPPDGEAA
ncbi:MAG: hypothetical protein JO168_07020 [Solirubrobacterales bacterium]|nr:hypothetical protein [Solirubrobacterales bacterium]